MQLLRTAGSSGQVQWMRTAGSRVYFKHGDFAPRSEGGHRGVGQRESIFDMILSARAMASEIALSDADGNRDIQRIAKKHPKGTKNHP